MFIANPVEYYYSNDYYLSQITKPEPYAHRSNTSYSPKKLITGYWKKDYKPFIKQKTFNLESKEISPHIMKHKTIKQSFARLAETILNVSNCFENIPNRQTKTDKFVQKLKQKIISPSPTPPKPSNHEIHKIPGRLYKGTLLKNFDNSLNQIDKSYILDSKQDFTTTYKSVSPKLEKKEMPPISEMRSKAKQKQLSNTQNEPSSTPYSPYRDLKQQLTIRRSMLNNNSSHTQMKKIAFTQYLEQNIEGMKLETLNVKLSNNGTYNLVMIQFENVLGYDEASFFGMQKDFIGSKQHEEYIIIRDHYFQRVNNHSSFYVHKNIKELFNSISRVYQIGLYTLAYPDLLKEFVLDRKLKVNGLFKIIDYKIDTFVVDVTEVINQLKIKNPQLLIFIQPYRLLNQQQSYIPKHSKIPYFEYFGQRFFIPFTQATNPQNYRLLALPQLNMQSLFRQDEQSKGFVQINYFIEQFTLALQSESNFFQYLTKSQNKIKCINQSSYFRALKQKLLQQLYFIDILKQPTIKNEVKIKKCEMVERIVNKFECCKQVETLAEDLINRNKEIIKKRRTYKQEKVNTLSSFHKQLKEQLIRLNYCEMFVDACYYLPY